VRLPADEIKLDRSFVQDIHLAGRRRRALVGVVVHLAEAFALELVAEGIERPEELEVLAEEGCILGQGYLLGHPMPGEALAEMLGAQPPLFSIVAPAGEPRRHPKARKGATSI